MADDLAISTRHIQRRYNAIPAAVLLPQFFLGFGWLRAGVAHAVSGAWWSGDELESFLLAEGDLTVGAYEPFLEYLVRPFSVVVAATVCLAEIAIGVLLLANRRVIGALLVGSFLNLQFIMAGAVSPSIFYLVIALVIVLWRLERTVSLDMSRRMARGAAAVAAVMTVVLLPYVTTLQPESVIEDPALVLIFLSTLFAVACYWVYHRLNLTGVRTRSF